MILIVAALVSMIDRSVMPPLVPVVATDLGTAVDAVGHSLTGYAAGYAGFQLVWSTLANRFGRIRVLTVSTAAGAVANAATALAVDPVGYTAARVCAGAAFAATITTVLIYLGDTLTMQRRAVATANLAAAISLGLAAGTLGAGAVAQWWSWRWVYVLLAAASAGLAVLLTRLPESRAGTGTSLPRGIAIIVGNPWATAILALTVIEGAVLVGVFNYLPVALQAEGVPVVLAGAVTAAFGFTVVLASQLMKLVLGRWPAWLLLLLAGAAMTAAYLALALTVSLLTVPAAAVLLGLAWALGHTTLQTWMTDAAADSRAVGMSLFSIALFTGAGLGAAAGNAAAGSGAFDAVFLTAALVSVGFGAAATLARARYVVRE